MLARKPKNVHVWQRDAFDWYVEPYACSAALFAAETFEGMIWDPACGMGRIVQEARKAGLAAVGTDIVKRGDLCASVGDFLTSASPIEFNHIVTNPPFALSEQFVLHALQLVRPRGKVAMLLPLVWMAGFSTKRDWLPTSPLRRVYPISPRPSMPPGAVVEAGVKPGNGTKDFAWFVWQSGYAGKPEIVFLKTTRCK
jgi:hypothetical protein